MNNAAGILILGAGHAGGTLASLLREQGHTGLVTLIGDETHPPYNRPPLSKAYLQGKAELEELLLKTPSYYQRQGIDMRYGIQAKAINRQQQTVSFSNDQILSYDKLVIATGSRPRSLPINGSSLANVLPLRTIDDAIQLRELFQHKKRLVLIGGGYIGLEIAASASAMGLTVTVVERESRLLARVASAPLSHFFQHQHELNGVRFILDTHALSFSGSEEVKAVHLNNGETLSCDMVVVGAGVIPNMELAQEAGLACDNGVMVNIHTQTDDPNIYAIGDVTTRPLPLYDNQYARVESVPNAMEQARQAAAHILGMPVPKPEVQWFWSDQYKFKLQIAGMALQWDQTLTRGNPEDGKFCILRLHKGVLQAAECINSPVDFMGAKQLIASQHPLDINRLTDTGIKLKEALAY